MKNPDSFSSHSPCCLLLLAGFLLALMGLVPRCAEGVPAAEVTSPFPLRVSASGRHLENARGEPFLLHGDTAWSLMVQLSREDTEAYLENRRQKGFNAILVNLIEYYYADHPPRNRYGDEPFTTAGDFSTPNEAYFAHADWVLQRAADKGILVILNPCYTGYSSDFKSSRDGWTRAIIANGPAKCRDYGRYVGRRFQRHRNIIWQAGGDTMIPAKSDLERNWLEILRGIQEHAADGLWSAHWYRFSTALDQSTFAPYMTLDNAYGGNRSYVQALRAYNRANPKPTFLNEGYYEDTNLGAGGVGTPQQMRAQAYWAILSGATGHIFGSDHIWAFGGPLGFPGKPLPGKDWRQGMDRQPSREMVFVKRLFEGRAWHDLVPDQDHSVVTSGYGTFGKDDRTAGGDYVAAARTADGSLVMAYVPSTGAGARTIAVDMARLSGAAHARWYNPTNGSYTSIAGSPFANRGSRDFSTPGDNGTGTNDWVLVLEAARAGNFTTGAQAAARFGVHEIVLAGNGSVGNPFDTLVTVRFTPPSGPANARTVWGFYDGENTWRARVYCSETGEWTWSSTCESDRGLHGKSGTFRCAPSPLRGRLLIHPNNPSQWMTEDGRWFLNLNDTAYFWLCAYDAVGKPVTDEDAREYVRDVHSRGITSLRSFLSVGPAGFLESRRDLVEPWRDGYFADDAMTRLHLARFRTADARLRWLLDEYPDMYMQIVLFPMGCHYAKDQVVWQTFSPQQKERLLRYIMARYAAYPQVLWLVANDVHYGPDYPRNNAFAREVGEYFARHDPWRHPFSTGHARLVAFAFPDEDWVTYLHLEHRHDLSATQAARYAPHKKPVFLGEDRYEQDHGTRLDPTHMTYWQRRLFWSWLLAGGSANYGGRWWTVHPYSQTGNRPTFRPTDPHVPFTAPLTGLDSVRPIRDYFEQRRIELSDFEPNDALVKGAGEATRVRAPKLMRRGTREFLIYHPHAAEDGQHARPVDSQAAALAVDLRNTTGIFAVEWYRAADGAAQAGEPISGGDWRELVAPWKGHDCVVRLLQDGTGRRGHPGRR